MSERQERKKGLRSNFDFGILPCFEVNFVSFNIFLSPISHKSHHFFDFIEQSLFVNSIKRFLEFLQFLFVFSVKNKTKQNRIKQNKTKINKLDKFESQIGK